MQHGGFTFNYSEFFQDPSVDLESKDKSKNEGLLAVARLFGKILCYVADADTHQKVNDTKAWENAIARALICLDRLNAIAKGPIPKDKTITVPTLVEIDPSESGPGRYLRSKVSNLSLQQILEYPILKWLQEDQINNHGLVRVGRLFGDILFYLATAQCHTEAKDDDASAEERSRALICHYDLFSIPNRLIDKVNKVNVAVHFNLNSEKTEEYIFSKKEELTLQEMLQRLKQESFLRPPLSTQVMHRYAMEILPTLHQLNTVRGSDFDKVESWLNKMRVQISVCDYDPSLSLPRMFVQTSPRKSYEALNAEEIFSHVEDTFDMVKTAIEEQAAIDAAREIKKEIKEGSASNNDPKSSENQKVFPPPVPMITATLATSPFKGNPSPPQNAIGPPAQRMIPA